MAASLRPTERRDPLSLGIDRRSTQEGLALLLDGQLRAAAAVGPAVPRIAEAVDLILRRLEAGGRLVYLAAGSPALIALGDNLEIPQTFGEDPARFPTILAGGLGLVREFNGVAEDDAEAGPLAVDRAGIGAGDCVVAISASGSTPFVVRALERAKILGAATVALAADPDAPLLRIADVAIAIDSGPEMVCGSTRMGAGTAQKIALNMISTAVAIGRGHVVDGHMVNLRADNAKLRERASRIVADLAGVASARADEALSAAGGDVKAAVLVAAAGISADAARTRLGAVGGDLRRALDERAGG